MGIAVSINYANVTPHFNFGIWKVSKAIHKPTNRPVSLWIVDYAIMKERERNKKNRRNYIQFLMEAIQNQQRIQHLNILKIIEVQSAKKKIGFSSEQIETNLSLVGNNKFSRDESIYITQQIATTMKFVHGSLHTAFMGIYPENIFLNSHFTLKLGMFIHSSIIQTDLSKITDPFIVFTPASIFHVPCNWAAPEVVKNDTITSRAECYMYGLMCVYIFTGIIPSKTSSSATVDIKGPIELCKSIPEEFQSLMKDCLSGDPASRPNFDSITSDDAFSSLVARIFQYIEIIREKSDRDLFNFFKGLKTAINVFSDRIIKQKFMPIFIFYVRKDPRFSYALLPIFFKCILKYNSTEYIEKVLRPIKSVTIRYDNPKVSSLLLDYIGMLLKRLPPEYHEELVFPIVFSCFKSTDNKVILESLRMMPSLMNLMKINFLRSDAVPNLLRLAEVSQSTDTVILVVNLISLTITKTGPEFIAETAIPVLSRVWQKVQWPKLADALADLVQLCEVKAELLFATTLQMALLIIANKSVSQTTLARMIVFVQNALKNVSNEYRIQQSEFDNASKFVPKMPELKEDKLKDILEEEEDEEEIEEVEEGEQFGFLGAATQNNALDSQQNGAQQQQQLQLHQQSQQQQQGASNNPFSNQQSQSQSHTMQQKQNDSFAGQNSSSLSSFPKQQPDSFSNQPSASSTSMSSYQQQIGQNDPFANQPGSSSSSFQQQPLKQFGSQNQFSQFQQNQQDRTLPPQNNPFFPFEGQAQKQQQQQRNQNSSSSSQFQQQGQQQQQPIAVSAQRSNSSFQFQQQQGIAQSNSQFSSSFEIFNQPNSFNQQRQNTANSFDIFRNAQHGGQKGGQQTNNNSNSFQSFQQYPQQQQPQQQQKPQSSYTNPINPYDNNGFDPFDF